MTVHDEPMLTPEETELARRDMHSACGPNPASEFPVHDDDAKLPDEYLLLASYCGDDNADCTEARPCADCLAMCNIFDADGKFIRELGESSLSPTIAEGVLREALEAADKRLCELTPNFPPDVGPDMRDAEEIEKTGHVVMQIRAALEGNT